MIGRLGRVAMIGFALIVALGPFVVLALNTVRPSDEFLSAGAAVLRHR